MQYISPTGEQFTSGNFDLTGLTLVYTTVVDGVTINVWERPNQKKRTKIDVNQDQYQMDAVRERRLEQAGDF